MTARASTRWLVLHTQAYVPAAPPTHVLVCTCTAPAGHGYSRYARSCCSEPIQPARELKKTYLGNATRCLNEMCITEAVDHIQLLQLSARRASHGHSTSPKCSALESQPESRVRCVTRFRSAASQILLRSSACTAAHSLHTAAVLALRACTHDHCVPGLAVQARIQEMLVRWLH